MRQPCPLPSRAMRAAIALAGVACAPTAALAAPVHWVGTWATSVYTPEPENRLTDAQMTDATLRQVVRISAGGPEIRIRLSNAFGTQPLVIDDVHVARAGDADAIAPGSDHPVTFDGATSVTIPAGAVWLSDPVAMRVAPLSRLTVSFHLPHAPAGQTGHPGSHATSWFVAGDHSGDAALPGASHVEHWYQLSGIDVAAPADAGAVVAYGDSITDGHASTTDGNTRWPDFLAARLQADPRYRHLAVLNEGIGGNHFLTDGLGPNALARFDRDVLGNAGVRDIILLEGINDLGLLSREGPASPAVHHALVVHMIDAMRQIVARAHAHGIRVIGATILPDRSSDYYHPAPENEADRVAVNAWIRAPGHFDAVVDLDAATRDPADPTLIAKPYDSGDGLHPGPAGYRAMANAIDLAVLK